MIEQPFTFRLCSDRARSSYRPQHGRLPKVFRWTNIARHNPHPQRVNHFYGLNNAPICHVTDPPVIKNINYWHSSMITNEALMPTNTLNGLPIFRYRNIPIKERAVPQVGFVPIRENWRQELRALTESVVLPISEEGGIPNDQFQNSIECHPYPICRPITAVLRSEYQKRINQDNVFKREKLKTALPRFPKVRTFSPDSFIWDDRQAGDYESQVFSLLGQILQTEDVESVKQWLVMASDKEKAIVMSILQSAVEHKLNIKNQKDTETENQKEDRDNKYFNEIEEHSEDFERLLLDSENDQSTRSYLARPKTSPSKIRPQSTCSIFSDPSSSTKSRPPTASVILRYKTSRKRTPESSEGNNISIDSLSLD